MLHSIVKVDIHIIQMIPKMVNNVVEHTAVYAGARRGIIELKTLLAPIRQIPVIIGFGLNVCPSKRARRQVRNRIESMCNTPMLLPEDANEMFSERLVTRARGSEMVGLVHLVTKS